MSNMVRSDEIMELLVDSLAIGEHDKTKEKEEKMTDVATSVYYDVSLICEK